MSMPDTRRLLAPSTRMIAEFGAYWTAKSPTPGTGLNTIATLTALVATSPFIQINAAAIALGAKSTYLDYCRLICRAPGTGGTSLELAVVTDTIKAAPTGGTQLVPVNVRSSIPNSAVGSSVWAGPLVAAAASAQRIITSANLRTVIPVIGDTYLIKFGAPDFGVPSGPVGGTLVFDDYIAAPPVILDPGFTGQIHIWLPAQSAASQWEVADLGFYEF